MTPITPWLKSRCRWQCFARGAFYLLEGLASFGVFCLILWGYETLASPIAEKTALRLLAILAVLLLAGSIMRLFRLLRQNSLKERIRAFCQDNPQDHDTLEAIVELETKASHETLRPFEQEFLQEAQTPYARDNFHLLRQSRAFRRPHWLGLALMAATLVALCFVLRPPVLTRAWNGLVCQTPGVEFLQMQPEVERHQDMEVVVQVNRYGGTPTLEVLENGVLTSTPMQPLNEGRYHLMLYDIAQPFALTAKTAYATSARHQIGVYDSPSPLRIAIDTIPPAYTRRASQHLDDFGNLEVIEGEEFRIHCEMPEDQSWELIGLALDGNTTGTELVFTPSHNLTLQAEYRDSIGHLAKGPEFIITVKRDLPPAIELIEPTTDTQCKPGMNPNLIANVTDDFGLNAVEMHFFLDNLPESTQLVWSAASPTSHLELNTPVDFLGTSLYPGQILTGWLEAADNREPTAQRIRSELFFVTVVPDENAIEADMEGMEGQETHEVDLADLIIESKRLLRNTFDLLNLEMDSASAERLRQELERDIRALELAVRSRGVDIQQQLQLPRMPAELQQFFTEISLQLTQAATDVTVGAIADSRAPQQSALVILTQLNNLLLENLMKMSAQGGEGTPEPGMEEEDEQGKKPSETPQPSTGDHEQEIAQMETARQELQRILKEQHAILDDLRRTNRLADAYAAPERLLATRTRNVGGLLSGIAAAEPIQRLLRDAQGELENAAQDFAASGQSETATLHARRAEKALQDSLTRLEQLLQELTTHQIEKLSEDAQKLSQRQRELATQSTQFADQPPTEEARKNLRDAQEAVTQETDALRQRLEKAARSLERDNPQGAHQLRMTMDTQDNAALQRAQSRARNALLYRRYGMAAEEQTNAADALQRFAEHLAEAGSQTGLSEEQLRAIMEKMQQMANHVDELLDVEQAAQLGQQLAELTSQLAAQLGNDALQAIAQELTEDIGGDHSTEELQHRLQDKLETIHDELQRELEKLRQEAPTRRLPPVTAPPRQYRQEVEEYFRRLGE